MLIVSTITCPLCHQTIYSRATHDFRWCKCESVAIDGGFDYVKLCWEPTASPPEVRQVELDVTKKELYNDWNTGSDRYGILPLPYVLYGHDFGKDSCISLGRGNTTLIKFSGNILEKLYEFAVPLRDLKNVEENISNELREFWEQYGPGGGWHNRPMIPRKILETINV